MVALFTLLGFDTCVSSFYMVLLGFGDLVDRVKFGWALVSLGLLWLVLVSVIRLGGWCWVGFSLFWSVLARFGLSWLVLVSFACSGWFWMVFLEIGWFGWFWLVLASVGVLAGTGTG